MPKNQALSKKILYIVTQSEWGGAQTYVFDLAYYFSLPSHQKFLCEGKNNWQVSVACGEDKDGELIKRLEKIDAGIFFAKNLKRSINLWRDVNAFFNLLKLCQRLKPDVVHLNSSKAGAIGAVAAKLAGVKKIIYTVHGLVLNEPLPLFKKIFYWLAEWISAKFKNQLICVSEFDKKSLLNYKICKGKKITVIYNGIDLENLRFLPKDEALKQLTTGNWQLADGSIVVGCIANLYKTKGLIYLIEAMREIIKVKPNIKLIIIGDGEERKRLEKLISGYKLQSSIFLAGAVEKASQYLKAFDIYVLPSIKEGLSYSLIEAQSAGLPSIATDIGGNAEIIEHNKNGILVPIKDFNKLAAEIINLAQNKSKQEKFSKNSLENAKRFDLRRMLEETERIYF
ncbi:MAG: glycosyltransferase family 4 protein [Candidatus Kuenenbacteria bacterium]